MNFISISSPALSSNGAIVFCVDLRSDRGSSFEPRWCNRALKIIGTEFCSALYRRERKLTEFRSALYRRERKLTEFRSALYRRERKLTEFRSALYRRERKLTEFRSALALYRRERKLTEFRSALYRRERKLTEFRSALYRRERKLTEFRSALYRRERKLTEFRSALYRRERKLTEFRSALYRRERKLTEFRSALALYRRERKLTEFRSALYRRERKLTEFRSALYRRERKLTEFRSALYRRERKRISFARALYRRERKLTEFRSALYRRERKLTEFRSALYRRERKLTEFLSALYRRERKLFCDTRRGRGGIVVRLLTSHQGEPGSIHGGFTPDFRTWESCRMISLVREFPQGPPVSPAFAFRRCSTSSRLILIGSQDLDVRAAHISSLTHIKCLPLPWALFLVVALRRLNARYAPNAHPSLATALGLISSRSVEEIECKVCAPCTSSGEFGLNDIFRQAYTWGLVLLTVRCVTQGSRQQRENRRFLWYNLYSWSLAALVVIVTWAVDYAGDAIPLQIRPLIGNDTCFYSSEYQPRLHLPGSDCLSPRRTLCRSRPCHSLILTCGNLAGRCRWSVVSLEDLPFLPPCHSGTPPYSHKALPSALKNLNTKLQDVACLLDFRDWAITCVARPKANPFSDWRREALGKNLTSDWLSHAAEGSLLVCAAGWRVCHEALIVELSSDTTHHSLVASFQWSSRYCQLFHVCGSTIHPKLGNSANPVVAMHDTTDAEISADPKLRVVRQVFVGLTKAVACGGIFQGDLVLSQCCTFSVHAPGASNHRAAWETEYISIIHNEEARGPLHSSSGPTSGMWRRLHTWQSGRSSWARASLVPGCTNIFPDPRSNDPSSEHRSDPSSNLRRITSCGPAGTRLAACLTCCALVSPSTGAYHGVDVGVYTSRPTRRPFRVLRAHEAIMASEMSTELSETRDADRLQKLFHIIMPSARKTRKQMDIDFLLHTVPGISIFHIIMPSARKTLKQMGIDFLLHTVPGISIFHIIMPSARKTLKQMGIDFLLHTVPGISIFHIIMPSARKTLKQMGIDFLLHTVPGISILHPRSRKCRTVFSCHPRRHPCVEGRGLGVEGRGLGVGYHSPNYDPCSSKPTMITGWHRKGACVVCADKADGQKVFFELPVMALTIVNIAFFVLTARNCYKVKAELQRLQSKEGERGKRRFEANKNRRVAPDS
ncbi:hypothetical protein PR048_031754 [Dryococelus australis]|uniref:Uncharacterized protein n=1 Tax=Dryococelus australis TaxID=614101 RepID=A0ABQ9G662_9NEOP|nr:hypothetical protein PR048_031754 [Dryococelus australis]